MALSNKSTTNLRKKRSKVCASRVLWTTKRYLYIRPSQDSKISKKKFAYPRNSLYSGIFASSDLWAINSFGSIQINDNLESYQDLSMESKIYLRQNWTKFAYPRNSLYSGIFGSSDLRAINSFGNIQIKVWP